MKYFWLYTVGTVILSVLMVWIMDQWSFMRVIAAFFLSAMTMVFLSRTKWFQKWADENHGKIIKS